MVRSTRRGIVTSCTRARILCRARSDPVSEESMKLALRKHSLPHFPMQSGRRSIPGCQSSSCPLPNAKGYTLKTVESRFLGNSEDKQVEGAIFGGGTCALPSLVSPSQSYTVVWHNVCPPLCQPKISRHWVALLVITRLWRAVLDSTLVSALDKE